MSAPRSGRDARKLVIFDVDGTLVDSQNFIVEAQTRAFASVEIRRDAISEAA